jgi:hypothetical protein
VAQSAYAWWVAALAPFAAHGYRQGWISDFDVELVDDYGRRVSIPRGGWTAAASIAAESDDRPELSTEDSATLASLMSIEDVTRSMSSFLDEGETVDTISRTAAA